jgi:hypothetical protein
MVRESISFNGQPMYNSQQNQEIIRLILRLRGLEQEYPNRMMIARRMTYRELIAKRLDALLRLRRQMIADYNKTKVPS